MKPWLACLCLSACATAPISEDAFEAMDGRVAERNQARQAEAWKGMQAKGYREATSVELLDVRLERDVRRRCLDEQVGDEPLTFSLYHQGQEGTPLMAKGREVCSFFDERVHQLVGTDAAGQAVSLVRVPQGMGMALDPQGSLVFLQVQEREISHRKVLVRRSCNFMPQVMPSPLEMGGTTRVIVASEPPRVVVMIVDHEELEMDCTEKLY